MCFLVNGRNPSVIIMDLIGIMKIRTESRGVGGLDGWWRVNWWWRDWDEIQLWSSLIEFVGGKNGGGLFVDQGLRHLLRPNHDGGWWVWMMGSVRGLSKWSSYFFGDLWYLLVGDFKGIPCFFELGNGRIYRWIRWTSLIQQGVDLSFALPCWSSSMRHVHEKVRSLS